MILVWLQQDGWDWNQVRSMLVVLKRESLHIRDVTSFLCSQIHACSSADKPCSDVMTVVLLSQPQTDSSGVLISLSAISS